jgi:hypothetical protein
MSRDSGRYDPFTDTWIDQNIKVDFAWGNVPMQPNDDRDEDAQLDPELDNHIIATSQYQGFPAFTPGAPYDDTIANVAVPNVVGLLASTAQSAILTAGLDYSLTTTAVGATSGNNDKIKTQTPAAGTLVNVSSEQGGDTVVSIVKYAYVAPSTNYNIAGIRPAIGIGPTGRTLYLTGAPVTHGIAFNDLITLSGTGVTNYNRQFTVFEVWPDDAFNTGGTRVVITNNSMDGTGGDVTNVGTYTKP